MYRFARDTGVSAAPLYLLGAGGAGRVGRGGPVPVGTVNTRLSAHPPPSPGQRHGDRANYDRAGGMKQETAGWLKRERAKRRGGQRNEKAKMHTQNMALRCATVHADSKGTPASEQQRYRPNS